MSTHSVAANEGKIWDGGNEPFGASYGKLMMWFFLLSDAFTFTALLLGYGALRFSALNWADPDVVFQSAPGIESGAPLVFVGIMTFILIMSSVTMVLAVEAGHRNSKSEVVKWMIWTVIGGAMFLGCQAWEWTHLFSEGASITKNPFAPELVPYIEKFISQGMSHHEATLKAVNEIPHNYEFTSLFFTITGFHGFHVLSGVVINIVITINAMVGTYQRRGHYEMIEKVGLYWHFVDLVWVFVFTFFYLV